jgi:hypothetical protein
MTISVLRRNRKQLTVCSRIPIAVNGKRLWLLVLHGKCNYYRKTRCNDCVAKPNIWISYWRFKWIQTHGVRPSDDKNVWRCCEQRRGTGSVGKVGTECMASSFSWSYIPEVFFRAMLQTWCKAKERIHKIKTNFVALVRERTIPTERPLLVGEVSANFCWQRVPRGQSNGSQQSYSRLSRLELLPFLSSSSSILLTRLNGPVPDPLLLRKSGSAGNRTQDLWICKQELWPLDHRGGQSEYTG